MNAAHPIDITTHAQDTPAPVIDIAISDPDWTQWRSETQIHELAQSAISAAIEIGHISPFDELSLALVSDEEIASLNAQYRNKTGPTNVLSFPSAKPESAKPVSDTPVLLGDIVLAHQTIFKQADAQGKTKSDHFTHLLIHGLLHLCGFDHEDEADAHEMEAKETLILKSLGIADPYANVAM